MAFRPLAVALAGALLAAACGGGGRGDATSGVRVAQGAPTPREDVPSALEDPDDPALPTPLVDTGEIVSGGPPPDGIPSIDQPRFLGVDQVGFLADEEPVLVLGIGSDVRAYPVQIMTWHEIVNDTVDGVPVSVSYCPLCNSAVAYDRRLGERLLEFGTSGQLYLSALVMYDRQTESLWSHFTGEAVAGALAGSRLRTYPVATVSWADFRAAHPGGLVLSRDTGFDRAYGVNPYPGYDDVGTSPFLFRGEVDGRLAAKTRVVGIRAGGDAVAVRLDRLAEERVADVELDGRRLVVWVKPGTASSLDAGTVAGGRDVGATGVFVPEVDGRALRFGPSGEGFADRETGSRWDVLGRATAGPLAGRELEPVEHVDTFWFAWAAFLPQTTVVP